jgi:DNA-binding XRE family transcriptional regulator
MFQLPEVPDFTVLLRKVAEKIGVSRQAVTKWEMGTGIRY